MADSAANTDSSAPLLVMRTPRGPLARYVENLWLWRDGIRRGGKDRMLPTGRAGLILNLLEDEIRVFDGRTAELVERLEGAAFVGPYASPFAIDTEEQTFVAGVSFHPGGAWPFVSPAQDELRNRHLPLRDVWGPGAASLRERMLTRTSPAAQLQVLEHALAAHLCRTSRHPAVALALREIERTAGAVKVARLAEAGSLSPRRLTRLFELEVGLTPKRYARLLRFRCVLDEVDRHRQVDWADVALRCGYYDQPHFIREFKVFAGFTPSEYLTLAGEFQNHVPVERA